MAPSRSEKTMAITIEPKASRRSDDQVVRVPQVSQRPAARQGCVRATAAAILMLISFASPRLTEIYLT
jgi:hypothetical protein